jgi:uncharacterized protein with von Willebrand factor type A (vWA) domain
MAPVGIVNTGDLSRMTSSALARLASPGMLGTLALADMLSGSAQGIDARDEQPAAGGDVVVLHDRSASMGGGDRAARAAALSMAAVLTSQRDGRRVVVCSFSGTGDQRIEVVCPGEVASLVRALKLLAAPPGGGGTDVDQALLMVSACIATLNKPDVLIVTDGDFDPIKQGVLDGLGEARVFGVFVDESGAQAHAELDAAWDLSGEITNESAGQIINALRRPRRARARKTPQALHLGWDGTLPF